MFYAFELVECHCKASSIFDSDSAILNVPVSYVVNYMVILKLNYKMMQNSKPSGFQIFH